MKILEVKERTPLLIEQLIKVWEDSVRATHHFLSEEEREKIKRDVPGAFKGISHLVVAEKEDQSPVALMGVEQHTLEMLFLSPEERGKGLGKKLIQYAISHYGVDQVAVNEQNPLAKGFYGHMGFVVYRRTECDGQGNPYPLLYMRRS